jgi:hypothetical protein
MSSDISSAHQRAAAAFNEIASAAKIAIEALARIAAEPGRAIEIVDNSLTAIEVILRPSEEAERVGSSPPNGDPYRRTILKAALPPPPTLSCGGSGYSAGQRA